jgi:hypothetical protein
MRTIEVPSGTEIAAGLVFGSLVAYMSVHEYGNSFGGSVFSGVGAFFLGATFPVLGVIGPVAYLGLKTAPVVLEA